jgi:hypothetical protein
MEKIAVCITTRNRHEILNFARLSWISFNSCNADIFIVDDASNTPVAGSSYRFEIQQGIAKAKNKCLELAQ